MEHGWIKLHRKLLSNPISDKPTWSWLWVVLLLKANHAPTKFIWNGRNITVNEGQFITGRKELSKVSGIHESSVQRILEYLEIEHQIEQQKTTKYRLITILNWKDYQSLDIKANNKRTTSEHKQEVKELKEVNTHANRVIPKNMKNTWKYNEAKNSDSYEDVVDADSGEKRSEGSSSNLKMKEVIDWATKRRGAGFVSLPKQYKALSKCKQNNIPISGLKGRWQEFEQDEYWIRRGFDFMDVVLSFDKKPFK